MRHLALLLASFALSSATLHAQQSSGVPDSHRPPPGMCRIWIDGVPPTHQPAPTDCATAIRKRPMNARVVFGNDASSSGSQRSFAPTRPGQSNFAAPSAQGTPTMQSAPAASHEEQDRSAQRQEQERQRIAAQQEQQRAEAQRVHDEQEKRAAHHDAPPTQHRDQNHAAPSPRPRTDHQARPPRPSFSARRPR